MLVACTLGLTACSTTDPAPTATSTPVASSAPAATPVPTPDPTPTPEPMPRFTNEPDAELAALLPTEAAGVPVIVAPFEDFALTPGDIGAAYGKIGDRFASLALAYVEQPRATLYAMRLDGEGVTTEDLEPHLATAGQYVGIAGLDRGPWTFVEAGGHQVWVRPEDNATAAGTMIYTWSSGDYVFLLIGVDDIVNRAIIEQLPGEPAPSPTPLPRATADASAPPDADESAPAEETAAPSGDG
jgi:hypothetical protein